MFNVSVITTIDRSDAGEEVIVNEDAIINIDNNYIERIITDLSSSYFRGRLPGTEGNALAVDYVQDEFARMGLVSPSGLNHFIQPFRQKVVHLGDVPTLKTYDKDGKIVGDYYHLIDFVMRANWLGTSISGHVRAPLIYIENSEDLRHKDLNGKILLIDNSLVNEYMNNDREEADGIIRHILSLRKDIKAVIIQNDTRRDGYFHVRAALSNQLRQVGFNRTLNTHVSNVTRSGTGPMIFYTSDFAFETLLSAARRGEYVEVSANKELIEVESANVIGIIEGTSDNNEYIVIGAHLDHLGGYDNGPYYPGALDNASGIATMLEIARILRVLEEAPQKTIVFMAFNGEEVYLAGSEFYASNPLFPLASTTMINIDMVGSKGANTIELAGYHRQSNYTQNMLKWFADNLNISARISNIVSSDHVHFAARGSQAVMITHIEENPLYHTILDTYDNTIDLELLNDAIELVLSFIMNQAY